MANKFFHIEYGIIDSNAANARDGRSQDHDPPMRIMVVGSAPGVNRMFYEAVILGQDGLPAATIGYDAITPSPGNLNPRISVRAGLWTPGAVIVDGVRID